MLDFFRKYQRYFFMVIAFVIIISFSFFGTYSTLSVDSMHEAVAFKAIDGTEVKRSELEDVVAFISTDAQDKLMFGGVWGPNFLNDGVITKDFISTGLAEILAIQYSEEIDQDLQNRLEKEKKYTPYVHPQAKFISVESAWANFAPSMKTDFDALKIAEKGTDPAAFKARANLFLMGKQLPPQLIRQILRYQEKQYTWITPDPFLERSDLSLFGYHTMEDWFGPRFVRILAQFIINSAKTAEAKGYEVSKAEAIADLMRNSELSFQQNIRNPQLGVANSLEYYNEQLRRLGMDQGRAVKAWRQIMLFRRLFNDVGYANVVDPFSFAKFQAFANESVNGTIYSLPEELRLGSFKDLQKLEVYLKAISRQEGLLPPKTYLKVDDVLKAYPELVQNRYLLEVAHVNKNALQSKVSIKETWNFEVEDQNWKILKEQFPELGIKKGDTREERLAALDSLDDKTRGRVDAFARAEIVDSHPEWLQEALESAPGKEMVVSLRLKGGKSPFIGLENRESLIRLLNQASVGENPVGQLKSFTGDNKNFYRIKVIDRAPQQEVMTYKEANEEGVLDQLVEKELQAFYTKNRELDPGKFKKDDQSYKSIAEVKDQVAEQYFDKTLKAIQKDYQQAMPDKSKIQTTNDLLSSLRFFAYMRETKKQLQKDPASKENLVRIEPLLEEGKLSKRDDALENQWKLESKPFHTVRSKEQEVLDHADLFKLSEKAWTEVYTYPNGQIYFVYVDSKGIDEKELAEKVGAVHEGIAQDAKKRYMARYTKELKEKGAISLNYLNRREEILEEPVQLPDNNAI